MPSIDDAHKQRWNLVKAGIPYVAAFGIPTAWRAHPSWGSPVGDEMTLDDGTVAQVFTGMVVRYDPATGQVSEVIS